MWPDPCMPKATNLALNKFSWNYLNLCKIWKFLAKYISKAKFGHNDQAGNHDQYLYKAYTSRWGKRIRSRRHNLYMTAHISLVIRPQHEPFVESKSKRTHFKKPKTYEISNETQDWLKEAARPYPLKAKQRNFAQRRIKRSPAFHAFTCYIAKWNWHIIDCTTVNNL